MSEVVTTDQQSPSAVALSRAADVLAAGGVVVMPTDSVYGIGAAAIPGNPGHERVFAIKQRERSQTLPLVCADVEDLTRYGKDVPDWAIAAARAYWPGALTFVVKASDAVPDGYAQADGTVALRVPDSGVVRGLCRRVGAIALTSANTHGAPSPASFAELEPIIVEQADLTIDGGACPVGLASTIVDATGPEPRILRQGSVTLQQILEAR